MVPLEIDGQESGIERKRKTSTMSSVSAQESFGSQGYEQEEYEDRCGVRTMLPTGLFPENNKVVVPSKARAEGQCGDHPTVCDAQAARSHG